MYLKHSKQSKGRKRDLNKSEHVIGQLYPVLRDAEGKVIDGYHRLDVDPNWKSEILENVVTEEQRLIVSAHANMGRRQISKGEKVRIINDLAEIYYQQGLRPDTRKDRIGKDNIVRPNVHFNEIKDKLCKSLDGILTDSQIRSYLEPKYMNQQFSKDKKEYHRNRINSTSAWTLLRNSHGVQLRDTYGDNFMNRLESEMLEKALKEAKSILRNRPSFIKEVEVEIKKEYDENINIIILKCENNLRADKVFINSIKNELREEIRLELIEEFNLDAQVMVVAV